MRGARRDTLSPWRPGLAGAAALVLLTACGGGGYGGGSSAESTAAEGSATETSAGSGQGDFCAQAARIDERVDSALSDVAKDDPSIADAFHQLADEIRAVEPPEEIAADWKTQADGLDRIADTLPGIDITDPDSLAKLEDLDQGLTKASENVTTYLHDQCGI
jgi:hypothetical protein